MHFQRSREFHLSSRRRLAKSATALARPLTLALAVALWVGACQTESRDISGALAGGSTATTGRDAGAFRQVPASADDAYAPPGNTDDGWFYELRYRDVILSPDGGHLLAMVPLPGPGAGFASPALMLAVHELETGVTHLLPEYTNIHQVAFSPSSKRAYLLAADRKSVAVLALKSRKQLGVLLLPAAYSAIAVSPDGLHLIASNTPADDIERANAVQAGNTCLALDGRDRCRMTSVRLADDSVRSVSMTSPVLDIDFLQGGKKVAVVSNPAGAKEGTSNARITISDSHFEAQSTGAEPKFDRKLAAITTSHCGSELQIVGGGTLGLLSAVGCSNGRVELYDLTQHKLLASLPSNAPVSVSRNGKVAAVAAFTADLAAAPCAEPSKPTDPAAPTAPTQKKGADGTPIKPLKTAVAILNLATGSHSIMPWSNHEALPRLVISHHGQHVYAQSSNADGSEDKFSLIRTHNLSNKAVIGGSKRLDQTAWSEDGKLLYVLSNGALYRIPSGESVATHVDVPGSPELMDLRQQGDLLVLAEATAPLFYLVDVQADDKVQSLHLFAK